MAKRKSSETTGVEGATGPQATPEQAHTPRISPDTAPNAASQKAAALNGLPAVESPSISPATPENASDNDLGPAAPIPGLPMIVPQPAANAEFGAADTGSQKARPRFVLRPRHQRYAKLAASVAIGAVVGAIGGTLLTGGFAKQPTQNVAALEENKSMQQSVAHLANEVTTLKAKLDAANKFAHTQVASIDKKLAERLKRESADVTGSISAPQTVAAAAVSAGPAPTISPVATAAKTAVPLPAPRPAQHIAMAEPPPQPPVHARLPVVQDWSIHDARGGYIYVEGHGDIYQIVPGAPLPGLGPVESIRRLGGRWVVTTPKGLIVSMRDRRFFE